MASSSPLNGPAARTVALELTNHARARMIEYGVRVPDLVVALTSSARRVRDATGVMVYGTNGVAVRVNLAMTVVVTVLPRGTTPARWRGRDEGVGGYRRDSARRRNRSPKRSEDSGRLSAV